MQSFESTAVVPAFNREGLIVETLTSLKNQQLAFSEIIVVDDGSSDNTCAVVENEFPDVKLIRTTNRGVQHARNTGARHAETEWVTFCDSDDLLDPAYTQKISRFLDANHQYDFIHGNLQIYTEEGPRDDELALAPEGFLDGAKHIDGFYIRIPNIVRKLVSHQIFWPSGTSIRVKALFDIGGYDTRLKHVRSEDLEFALRAVTQLNFALSDEPLAKIRKHGSNISSDSVRQRVCEAVIIEHFLQTYLAAKPHSAALKRGIYSRRNGALVSAYENGDFEACEEILDALPVSKTTIKGLVKRAVVNLPPSLRDKMWKLTRAVS